MAQSDEQKAPSNTDPQTSKKTYLVDNGTETYSRTEESERRKTQDGEIEIQRVLTSSWDGQRVVLEREIRTKKLPDGALEREYVLRNPNGADQLVPIEITRETIKKNGQATTLEREVLKPDLEGNWTATRKENVRSTGFGSTKMSTREISEPSAAGGWQVVDREVTSTTSSGGTTQFHSVRQIPSAYGRLADYERREERATAHAGQESREVTLSRRSFEDTDPSHFYLVEQTTSERAVSRDGKVILNSTTRSDVVGGGVTRNTESEGPEVVEKKTEVKTPLRGGGDTVVVTVEKRDAVNPDLRPSPQLVQETDRNGNVRQIFIPAR